LALLFSLITFIRFFFKEQQKALLRSNSLNIEIYKQKNDLERSQNILLSIMQDIEKEKLQTKKLNELLLNKNKEMEQFIYTVSHDLKSPLVTIGAFTQKLISEISNTLTEKQSHRLNRILQNVNNMEAVLTDLLDLSRIVQQSISTTNVNLKTVVDQQYIVLEESIREANATINVADFLHDMNANERLLSEAILNLLSNSLRYREPSINLVINISTSQTDSFTTIHVQDNGIGIDPKYHDLIFKIFEKLSTTVGTGVGLTIVKTIMDKHKGQVTLESQLGEGCCFSLAFPNDPK
jgi:signal transduction histidine kinase